MYRILPEKTNSANGKQYQKKRLSTKKYIHGRSTFLIARLKKQHIPYFKRTKICNMLKDHIKRTDSIIHRFLLLMF